MVSLALFLGVVAIFWLIVVDKRDPVRSRRVYNWEDER